ncbi:DUF1731 domain-containing protein [Propionibacteriaceae bacterium Y1700]|uniref:DUF1731 domain-containing protein n=1 Tax=Microlunatus sp. Y1700 TaxID=3418487 RepID=UPI003DA72A12
MSWTRSASQFLAVDPATVWQVIGDPTQLPLWSPTFSAVTVQGEPAQDTEVRLTPAGSVIGPLHSRTAPPARITAFTPQRRLEITQEQPGGTWQQEWRLTPYDGGTVLTQQNRLTGPLARGASVAIGDELADFSVRCVRLLALAEVEPFPDALRVVIAGGSGSLGRRLAAELVCRGQEVVILTRAKRTELPFTQRVWDGRTVGDWTDGLFDEPSRTAVVNLAGQLIDGRPTKKFVAELTASRVDSTTALVEASRGASAPLQRWVQASTASIWGDTGEQRLTEASPVPESGLAQMTGVAVPWEQAVEGANAEHLTVLRTSIVFDRASPVLEKLGGLAKVGLGGRVGSGRQWFSWIHIDDWLSITLAALGLDPARSLDGVVVASAPNPVRNEQLMRLLRAVLSGPPSPPTPAPLVRLGAFLMDTDPQLALTGRHATSQVLAEQGFEFAHPELEDALRSLLR